MALGFVKMHGLGNDFVLMNFIMAEPDIDWPLLAQRICDRRLGVGADGLVLILPSDYADLQMRIFNPDGSEAEMCGNAIRCVSRYLYERTMILNSEMTIETKAGIKKTQLLFSEENGLEQILVRVDMGIPVLEAAQIPVHSQATPVVNEGLELETSQLQFSAVSMGNPHCVVFVPTLESVDFYRLGPEIEVHPRFPKKTNVEFVQVISPRELKVRVWERGAGETLACGTGACAVAVAAVLNGLAERAVAVDLPGGRLEIEWAEDGRVFMTGPAQYVFEGKWPDI